MKLTVVIPAFNESGVISTVLKTLPKKINKISRIETVVVNDGSWDNTANALKKAKVYVINHVLNRGAGAATKTGIEFAKKIDSDVIVTFDADGQHNPRDIEKIISPIVAQKAHLVIGSRLKSPQKMPLDRFILNWLGNIATLILFGVYSTDTQSGLRAFSRNAAAKIDFKSDRMEFSSEIIQEARKHNLKIQEVAVSAIYTKYSRSKGQKNLNALPIFIRTLVKLLR